MQIYCVGGAVRDELLGLPVKDRDYVVVGSTPDEMIKLGFKPVGNDFPVFLHPSTHEEYALARTERKSGPGYKGFVVHSDPGVSLEQDLARRDLTINAIAKDVSGQIIDPYNGVSDLKSGTLRHVSEAFVEDPVRILRVARFAARFAFKVAPETENLMRTIVAAGEAGALVPERVWQEISRGLMEVYPVRMFTVLENCRALEVILPELHEQFCIDYSRARAMQMLEIAARENESLALRFAVLNYHFSDLARVKSLCQRLKAPNDCRDLALTVVRFRTTVDQAQDLNAEELLCLIDSADAFRKPQRFEALLRVCEIAYHVDAPRGKNIEMKKLKRAFCAARSVDGGEIARRLSDPSRIKREIFSARTSAIEKAVSNEYN